MLQTELFLGIAQPLSISSWMPAALDVSSSDAARAFDQACRNLLPSFDAMIALSETLAFDAFRDGTSIVDCGAATGDLIDRLARRMARAGRNARFVGIEPDAELRALAEERLCRWLDEHEVHLRATTADGGDYRDASVVIANFAFTNADASARRRALARIAAGLAPGGLLILSDLFISRSDCVQRASDDFFDDALAALTLAERAAVARHLFGQAPRITWADQVRMLADEGFGTIEPVASERGVTTMVASKR